MAVLPRRGLLLQERLQCAVCFYNYDLDERCPFALRCQHTSCRKCVKTLTSDDKISCPICKRVTSAEDLSKNFALSDVLETLCEECMGNERERNCDHCAKQLCEDCIQAHAHKFHEEVKSKVEQLQEAVKSAAEVAMDDSTLNRERQRYEDTMDEIDKTTTKCMNELQNIKRKLQDEVKDAKNLNTGKDLKWRTSLEARVNECKAFIRQSFDSLGNRYSALCPNMPVIRAKADELLSGLEELKARSPELAEYTFVEANVSNITIGQVKVTVPAQVDTDVQTLPADRYKRAVFKAMTGSRGSGPDQFEGECGVAFMEGKLIITDRDNDRIKVYNSDLHLFKVFGEKGTKDHQFDTPTAICIGPGRMIYICDTMNARIKVYDENFQFVKKFGSQGAGHNEFFYPRGLAFTSNGKLLVCDSLNHRVKVIEPSGTYILSIGSKGDGPGQLSDRLRNVSVTPHDNILVTESGASFIMMFRVDGTFLKNIVPSLPHNLNPIEIWHCECDKAGNMILADFANDALIVFDAAGEFVCTIGSPGDKPGQFKFPLCTALGTGGNLLVYEFSNSRIQLFELHEPSLS